MDIIASMILLHYFLPELWVAECQAMLAPASVRFLLHAHSDSTRLARCGVAISATSDAAFDDIAAYKGFLPAIPISLRYRNSFDIAY